MQRKVSELRKHQFQDEIERLENFGAIRVFDDSTAMDYLTIGGSGPAYHPLGSKEYLKEVEDERKAKERKLTIKEAKELGDRLSKRREHDHYCTCNLCEPNGATDHIKSFGVKPKRRSYSRSRSRSRSAGRVAKKDSGHDIRSSK